MILYVLFSKHHIESFFLNLRDYLLGIAFHWQKWSILRIMLILYCDYCLGGSDISPDNSDFLNDILHST